MKTYNIYIESANSEVPDIDDSTIADSFEEAVRNFQNIYFDLGFTADEIRERIYCEDECPDCHGELREQIEQRQGGYFENILYCDDCGRTEVSK